MYLSGYMLYSHLEKPTIHVTILFNLLHPHILANKMMSEFNLGNRLVAWIVDFLSYRRQCVSVNGKCSYMRLPHTGSPQVVVSHPFYASYTQTIVGMRMLKGFAFADGSALLSLLCGSQQDTVRHYEMLWSGLKTSLWFTTRHGPALRDVVEWCNDFSVVHNKTRSGTTICCGLV